MLRVSAEFRETAVADDIAPDFGTFVTTAEGRLFVVDEGPPAGVPVLLFHGTAGWSVLWRETQAALTAAGFRSIAYDIPPFGFSDRPAANTYGRGDQARRVVALLDALGVDRVILVGHSFGAGPALETALRAPARVSGLVLVDAAVAVEPTEAAGPAWALTIPFVRETLLSATATNPLATRWLLSQFITRKEAATEAVADTLRLPMTVRGTTAAMGHWALAFMGGDTLAVSNDPARFTTIGVPAAVVWGEADTVTPLANGEALARLLPGAQLEIIPGVGHIPHLEDPALAIPAIVAAVESVAQGGTDRAETP